ncbi:MAG TPA: GtrA family protein [Candidatus Fimivivens faecavium]|nr:GtrA family protein [Candidatus Fimivivens faecavium]
MNKYVLNQTFHETIRYLICGATTVAVNVVAYHLLSCWMEPLTANTIAFFIAVLYAYFGNSLFVFRTGYTWKNFSEFMAMRIGTLFIDNGGMYLMLNWNWNDLAAKCIVNFIIIALNYILSKLLIFKNKKVESE